MHNLAFNKKTYLHINNAIQNKRGYNENMKETFIKEQIWKCLEGISIYL